MNRTPEHFSMSFGDHLEELRVRLLIVLLAPAVLFIPGMIFGKAILRWLTEPVYHALNAEGLPARLQALTPVEPFLTYLKVALLSAVVCSAPVLIWQIWKFIEPGLYRHERRFVYLLIPMSIILTALGILFMYYIMLPLSLRMLVRFGNGMNLVPASAMVEPYEPVDENGEPIVLPEVVFPTMPELSYIPPGMETGQFFYHTELKQLILMGENQTLVGLDTRPMNTSFTQEYRLKDFLSFIFTLILAFSIAFQLPLVILLLGWVGMVSIDQLKYGRRYAVLGVFVFGAILTPPDVISQIFLAVPLYMLYEVSIILLKVVPIRRLSERGTSEWDTLPDDS